MTGTEESTEEPTPPGHTEEPSELRTKGRRTSRAKDSVIIAALAAGATQLEAAHAAQVSERTIRRRLESHKFRNKLQEAEAQIVGQVSKRLTGLAPTAAETLAILMSSPDVADQVKLRASLGVLATTRVWREGTELEMRLLDLESRLADTDQEQAR